MKNKRYYPSLDSFLQLADRGSLIPVYREILADVETPVSAFKKIDDGGDAFLFESVEGGEKWGRYSFIGISPRAVLKAFGNTVEIVDGGVGERMNGDFIGLLRRFMSRFRPVEVEGIPRFYGGAVGYAGYDMVRSIETLPSLAKDDITVPDAFFMIADTVLVFDNLTNKIKVISSVFLEEGCDPAEAYARSMERIDSVVEKLRKGTITTVVQEVKYKNDIRSNFSREDFLKAVSRVKEYIMAGDVVQTVISQRFQTDLDVLPLDIYRALRIVNPSPYMFFLRLNGIELVGSSPEILVRVEGRRVDVRPIAGTRPRGSDDEEDRQLEEGLLKDSKERAEHIMLVDLGRNDVGKVAETGSVNVNEFMVIERYSHVMHIASNVQGVRKEGKDSLDALSACFPAGTLTGAPKVRAMEIIEEMEPCRRGPYGGAVGYIGFSGNMDMCIAIRTIVIKDSKIHIQAGAGIVADSVPEKEYQETINKARGVLKAVEMVREGLE